MIISRRNMRVSAVAIRSDSRPACSPPSPSAALFVPGMMRARCAGDRGERDRTRDVCDGHGWQHQVRTPDRHPPHAILLAGSLFGIHSARSAPPSALSDQGRDGGVMLIVAVSRWWFGLSYRPAAGARRHDDGAQARELAFTAGVVRSSIIIMARCCTAIAWMPRLGVQTIATTAGLRSALARDCSWRRRQSPTRIMRAPCVARRGSAICAEQVVFPIRGPWPHREHLLFQSAERHCHRCRATAPRVADHFFARASS